MHRVHVVAVGLILAVAAGLLYAPAVYAQARGSEERPPRVLPRVIVNDASPEVSRNLAPAALEGPRVFDRVSSLPFTGGEGSIIAVAGVLIGLGAVLVVTSSVTAKRRRST